METLQIQLRQMNHLFRNYVSYVGHLSTFLPDVISQCSRGTLAESYYRAVSRSILSIILQKDILVSTGGYICQWVGVRFARKDRIVLSSVGCHFARQSHLFKLKTFPK